MATATLTNGVASVLSQMVALFVLGAAEYGRFALIYLFFGLASSIMLSSVCEAWVRTQRDGGPPDNWSTYGGVATYVAATMAAVAWGVAAAAGLSLSGQAAAVVAMLGATFRVGARYHEIHQERFARAILADSGLMIGLTATWIGARFGGAASDATLALWAWATGSVLSVALGSWPPLRNPRVVGTWLTRHGHQIKALQGESILMDLGAMLTPLVLIPLLSIEAFGVYRAVSSVAAPVRLVLNPLRPALARRERAWLMGTRVTATVVAAALAFSLGAGAVLAAIGHFDLRLGTLRALAPFAVPVGLYVFANMVGHFSYLLARLLASVRALFANRVIQTILVTVVPLAGALLSGLPGAIWGLGIATLLNAAAWHVGLRLDRGKEKP